jgi:hypothetical protein
MIRILRTRKIRVTQARVHEHIYASICATVQNTSADSRTHWYQNSAFCIQFPATSLFTRNCVLISDNRNQDPGTAALCSTNPNPIPKVGKVSTQVSVLPQVY